MRKPFAMLAVTGALVGSAHAQAGSVTIYGIVDAAAQVSDFDRIGSLKTVNSGHRNASRLGFRGTESLGGDLNAIFQLENGFSLDTGVLGQGGRIFGRQVYVGLSSRHGTVAMGRISTFDGGAFDMFTEIDPFIAGFGVATLASTMTVAGGLRVDNALLLRTPRLGGFQAGWLHSVGEGTGPRVDDLGANFRAGPFYTALTYAYAKHLDPTFARQKMLTVGATYDLKFLKLHGAYANEKGVRSALLSAVGATAEGTDATAWMLGLTVPFGPLDSRLRAGIQKRDGKEQTVGTATFNADRTVYGIAYEYLLSKRTIVHVSHAKSRGSNTLQQGRAATDFANKKEYTAGITHLF